MFLFFMKLNVQAGAEMEVFAMKGMSVNVQMDFMGLIVRKVTLKIPSVVFFTIVLLKKSSHRTEISLSLNSVNGLSWRLSHVARYL